MLDLLQQKRVYGDICNKPTVKMMHLMSGPFTLNNIDGNFILEFFLE